MYSTIYQNKYYCCYITFEHFLGYTLICISQFHNVIGSVNLDIFHSLIYISTIIFLLLINKSPPLFPFHSGQKIPSLTLFYNQFTYVDNHVYFILNV